MKWTWISSFFAVVCAMILSSCASTSRFTPGSGNKYQYTYKLVYPIEASHLLFQDDSVIIQFKFDETAIRFQLQNISESQISIQWRKASIHINGRFQPVRHSTNLAGDSAQTESLALPPLGYIREIAVPQNNIQYDGDRLVETDLLPTIDHNSQELRESILKSKGQHVGLNLPILFGNVEKLYEFDFQVDSVKQLPWKDYAPVKNGQPTPTPKHSAYALDNVTTAIIVVGILGFSAYILSSKKNPPSE
jgi:hypothetical protein